MRLLLLTLIAVTIFPACQRPPASTGTNTEPHEFTEASDVIWASPKGFDLTMDIYTPQTRKKKYPVIVMYHGGGWLVNNKSIMDDGAAYLASHGEYVVCNVNYRLLVDLENSVTMDEIVEDAFGALLWVQENIGEYGGDPDKIIVTGDSAGGHLATMVATQGHKLSETKTYGAPDYLFRPSYIPAGGLPEEGVTVAGAMISYGAFNHVLMAETGFEKPTNIFWMLGKAEPRGIFGPDYTFEDHREMYEMVSPIYLVEPATERDYPPMLFTVGSRDELTTPATIEAYIDKLKEAGHDDLQYWVHQDRPHAFLDSGTNPFLGIEFSKDAVPALDYMLAYLNEQF